MRVIALVLLLSACAPTTSDFIEAHGALADGTRIDVHAAAQTLAGAGAQPQLGNVIALTAAVSGPEMLRGLRLEWLPGKVTVGSAQASAPSGPVIFYVGSAIPDGGMFDSQLSVVNGGAITFTQNTARATGSLANLVLMRRDASGVDRTLVTIDSGSFSATNP